MATDRITNEWVMERLDRLWPAHTAGIARLLIGLRAQFDGDLDAALILAVVSLGAEGEGRRDMLFGDPARPARLRPTNTRSLSIATGIPRETLRRKLDRLQERGWVERSPSGNWEPTRQAARDLRPATIETIAYLRTILSAAAQERPPPPGMG